MATAPPLRLSAVGVSALMETSWDTSHPDYAMLCNTNGSGPTPAIAPNMKARLVALSKQAPVVIALVTEAESNHV